MRRLKDGKVDTSVMEVLRAVHVQMHTTIPIGMKQIGLLLKNVYPVMTTIMEAVLIETLHHVVCVDLVATSTSSHGLCGVMVILALFLLKY